MFSIFRKKRPQSSLEIKSAKGSSTYNHITPLDADEFKTPSTAIIRHDDTTVPAHNQDDAQSSFSGDNTQIVRIRDNSIPLSQAQKEAIALASKHAPQEEITDKQTVESIAEQIGTVNEGSADPTVPVFSEPISSDMPPPLPIKDLAEDVHSRPTFDTGSKEQMFAQAPDVSIPAPALIAQKPNDTDDSIQPRDTVMNHSPIEQALDAASRATETDLSDKANQIQSESDLDSLFEIDEGSPEIIRGGAAAEAQTRPTVPDMTPAFERADTDVMNNPFLKAHIEETDDDSTYPYTARLRVAAQTNIGKKRNINEDRYNVNLNSGLFLLADGMGGHTRGDDAAEATVDLMKNHYAAELTEKTANAKEFVAPKSLEDAINIAHGAIIDLNGIVDAHKNNVPITKQMGTTIAALAFYGDKAHVSNVGDSRVYRGRHNPITKKVTFTQLSEDHTKKAYNLKNAKNKKEREYFLKNSSGTLLQAVGIPPGDAKYMSKGQADKLKLQVSHKEHKVKGGDLYLICSDGLTDTLSPQELAGIVDSASDIDEACDDLITAANNNGGHDNITAILVEVQKEPVEYFRKVVAGVAAAAMIAGVAAIDRLGGDELYQKIGEYFKSQPSVVQVVEPPVKEVAVVAVADTEKTQHPGSESQEFDFSDEDIQAEIGTEPVTEKTADRKMMMTPMAVKSRETPVPSLEKSVASIREKLQQSDDVPADVEAVAANDTESSAVIDKADKNVVAAYSRVVKKIKSDHPKSKVPEYNLSPDAKTTISHQGVINTAYWFGTRTDKDKSNDYRGGHGTKTMRGMADKWLKKHTGQDISYFIADRSAELVAADIAHTELPNADKEFKKKAGKKHTKHGTLDENLLNNALALEQIIDKSYNTDSRQALLGQPVYNTEPKYTSVQKTVIEHLYKEFKFAKAITSEEMSAKAAEYSIQSLTPELASQVYLDMAAERETQQDDGLGEEILLTEIIDDVMPVDDEVTDDNVASDNATYELIQYCLNSRECAVVQNLPEYEGDRTIEWEAAQSSRDARMADYANQKLEQQWKSGTAVRDAAYKAQWEQTCKNRNLAEQWKTAMADTSDRQIEHKLAA
ncbi:MAG: protein phosphatase 2C domain-containing protein [Candidatus Woesearchaeota archaeon]